ncbi:unnamed protein product [Protopolystoma xenopodis]|uniref:Uncharacterized protein n=1 Tax=Protopolystoma xenopodis TaxID=117903 RepID=A0A448XLE0_9PLAT|nr:unnamed protein product [Protopolystoma xenopodis]
MYVKVSVAFPAVAIPDSEHKLTVPTLSQREYLEFSHHPSCLTARLPGSAATAGRESGRRRTDSASSTPPSSSQLPVWV